MGQQDMTMKKPGLSTVAPKPYMPRSEPVGSKLKALQVSPRTSPGKPWRCGPEGKDATK